MKLNHQNIVAYITMKSMQAETSIEVDVLQQYIAGEYLKNDKYY